VTAELERALRRFETVLDSEGVLTTHADLALFHNPFSFPGWTRFRPAAALLPTSVEEVQAILRIANEHKVPLLDEFAERKKAIAALEPNAPLTHRVTKTVATLVGDRR
jgi:4-cresol dehydrogenase (hydroxylating)